MQNKIRGWKDVLIRKTMYRTTDIDVVGWLVKVKSKDKGIYIATT